MNTIKPKIQSILKNLPQKPGVYLMRNSEGNVIYVGKAKKLKRRVSSYFRHSKIFSARLVKLVESIEDISIIRTETEAEALIVEARLIKKYSPFFNVELKMSEKYPYIKITDEEFPRLEITRHKSNDGALYLGPYVSAGTIKNLMRLAERYFPLRICKSKIKPDKNKRPCIEYNLGHSMGACAALCSKTEYRERVSDLILLFNGKSPELIERLRTRMNNHAEKLEFEKAAFCRDTIKAIWKASRYKVSSALQEDLDNATWKVLTRLQELLNLPVLPWRIDAFDISHTYGHETYGCCIVFEQGKPNKNLYRRFKIRSLQDGEINDFQSIYETVKRRYNHVIDNSEPSAQLALIDGGKGQLEYAQKAIHELNFEIPMIALAEREEIIFLPNKDTPLILERSDPALQILQRLRDEVHRFAITTHRNARESRMKHSKLHDIKGIGKLRATELLVKFGSVEKISTLNPEELATVKGIGLSTAEKILEQLKK